MKGGEARTTRRYNGPLAVLSALGMCVAVCFPTLPAHSLEPGVCRMMAMFYRLRCIRHMGATNS